MSVVVAFEDRHVWGAAPLVVIVYSREKRRLRCPPRVAIRKSITPEA